MTAAPAPDRGRGVVPGRRRGFVAAVTGLAVAFAVSASPVPVYNTYRTEDGLTNADLSITVVAYFAGTMTSLLLLGRLSNHLGRRRASLLALGSLAAGALVLLGVDGVGWLVAGRLLMGLGAGLASSSLTSYIVDTAPVRPAWIASVASSQAPMLGLTAGALGSGALVEHGPWPRTLVYLIGVAAIAVSAVLVITGPETAARTPGVRHSLRPRVFVPAHVQPLLPVASVIFLATWATGALYQTLIPSLTADRLGTDDALTFGLVFAAYMAPSVIGAPVAGRFTAAGAQRCGMIIFAIGVVGLVTALTAEALVGFVVASVVSGVGQGIAISASIRGLLHDVSPVDRAPTFAAIYLISYGGAAVPSLISGQLSVVLSPLQVVTGYAGLAVVVAVITLLAARSPGRGRPAGP